MTYPTNWPEVRNAAQAYVPPESVAEEYAAAIANVSSAPFCVGVFSALKSVGDLDNTGLGIALGCAHLINMGVWFGKQAEAMAFLIARASDYVPESQGLPQEP